MKLIESLVRKSMIDRQTANSSFFVFHPTGAKYFFDESIVTRSRSLFLSFRLEIEKVSREPNAILPLKIVEKSIRSYVNFLSI